MPARDAAAALYVDHVLESVELAACPLTRSGFLVGENLIHLSLLIMRAGIGVRSFRRRA